MKTRSKMMWWVGIATLALAAVAAAPAGAQVLTGDQLKKVIPNTFFFSGQVATVEARNSVGLKNFAGKLVLAGLVDTTGYATAIAEKFHGFLITEAKLNFEGATLEPGAYGFGFKDGKLTVMNVAGTDVLSVASQNDDQVKHPVPLKFEKSDVGYRLYAGRKYVAVKAD
jgi:hypothetical protein